MIYPRNLISAIEPFLNRKEFIAIIGPRQSGKTTLLEILKTHLIEKSGVNNDLIRTVTFEDRRLLAQFESNPISFVKSYIPEKHSRKFYFMIDEFQYAIDGGQKLKLIYDTVKNLKVIITGSSSLDIKAKVGRFMVGRIVSFKLLPFNFQEFLRVNDTRLEKIYAERNAKVLRWLYEGGQFEISAGKDTFSDEIILQFEDFCIWGGYPAVAIARDTNIRKKLLGEIYNNYILKDIKTLLELATEKNLFRLSQHLAVQVGSIIVYQNLSNVSGLDYRNVKKHLNILEETFICQEINPFFRNRQKELTKSPKVYFLDMGFRNNLIESFNPIGIRTDAGAIVENVVFIRLNELFMGLEKINFWRTKTGAEVDFLLHIKGDIIPIEVKYSSFATEKLSRSFMSFINSFRPKKALVLTKNYWGQMQKDKTRVLFAPVLYV